jgi:hypothetical protein
VTGAPLYGGLEVETRLDPSEQPFLFDHQIDGVPVLPGVMGAEAFAEVASLLCPDCVVTGLRDVEFLLPFKFHRMQPATLHLSALGRPGTGQRTLIEIRLSSRLQPKPELPVQERLHFRGWVALEPAPAAVPRAEVRTAQEPSFGRDAIYRVYFHGPAYRVLEGVRLEHGEAVGVVHRGLPANAKDPGAAELVWPRLAELCFQTAGVVDLAERSVLGLPARVDALRVFHPEGPPADGCWAEVRRRQEDEGFDARVVDARGDVLLELAGYHTIALPERKTLEPLHRPAGEGVPA